MRSSRLITVIIVLVTCITLLGAKKSNKSQDTSKDQKAAAGALPKDAQWTLYCQAVAGPEHVARANQAKQQLIDGTKMKDWYVIHQDEQSVIYYGFYRDLDDPKGKADKKKIDDLRDPAGNKIVGQIMFVEINAPDPEAPPQWNLQNAQGYWSVEIAMYKDHPQRKQAAVDAVKAAREQGIEAYYYHGQTASSVCVGAWPKDAVQSRIEDETKGIVPDTTDPEATVLVLPKRTSDQDKLKIKDREGGDVETYAPEYIPTDERLIATMQKFSSYSINGEVYVKQVNGRKVEDPSKLVKIPMQQTASILRQSQPAAPQLINPITPSQTPGAGRLKSIGQ